MLSMEAYAPQAFLKQNGAQNECYVFLINRAIVVSNVGIFLREMSRFGSLYYVLGNKKGRARCLPILFTFFASIV